MGQPPSLSHGVFSWFDLVTNDRVRAKRFYESTFGWKGVSPDWTTDDFTIFRHAGNAIAGLFELSEEQREQDTRPHWLSYVSVSDVDEVTEKAAELGGRIVAPPTDLGSKERISIIEDPDGAVLGLHRPANWMGMGRNQPGSTFWSEHVTRDREAIRSFYTSLLGWEPEAVPTSGEVVTRFMGPDNGKPVAGMVDMDEHTGAPHWRVYFAVKDLGDTTETLQEHGGVLLKGPEKIEGLGFAAMVADPQGAPFCLICPEGADQPAASQPG